MSRLSILMYGFSKQPFKVKAAVIAVLAIAGTISFTVGVGGAAIAETVVDVVSGRPTNAIIIEPKESAKNPTTLKIEIVRNGNTICKGERAPTDNKPFDKQRIIEHPIADCPPLQVGDKVRATWMQQSEVQISFKD